MTIQKRIIIEGQVQGVSFRFYTEKRGKQLGLKGIVRNLSNGNVEILVEGDADIVDQLEEWCWEGSPYSHVTNVFSESITNESGLSAFRIVY